MDRIAIQRSFGLRFYVSTLSHLLGHPRDFFIQFAGAGMDPLKALGFLMTSALICAGASLMNGSLYGNPAVMGGIFLLNAVGMAVICAGSGYLVMVMAYGKQLGFGCFFSVYALSAGVVVLAAWMPFFVIFTEPWKWYLIGLGLVHGCGLGWRQALIIMALSIAMVLLLFYSALPLISG